MFQAIDVFQIPFKARVLTSLNETAMGGVLGKKGKTEAALRSATAMYDVTQLGKPQVRCRRRVFVPVATHGAMMCVVMMLPQLEKIERAFKTICFRAQDGLVVRIVQVSLRVVALRRQLSCSCEPLCVGVRVGAVSGLPGLGRVRREVQGDLPVYICVLHLQSRQAKGSGAPVHAGVSSACRAVLHHEQLPHVCTAARGSWTMVASRALQSVHS